MRSGDGRLIADLNDNLPANISASVLSPATSSLNENLTTYVLLPEIINRPPYISQSIYKTSEPEVKPIQFNEPDTKLLFVDRQGIVKVLVGTSFKLKLKALQPPIYNVENGKPTLIVDAIPTSSITPTVPQGIEVTTGSLESGLVYAWEKDGDAFIKDVDAQRPGSQVYITGSMRDVLCFENISPKFAGTYTCLASNDIGSTESEQVTIEVYNPDIEDAFYNNLITNPYGKKDLDQWLTPDEDFVTARFTNAEFSKLSQPWNQDTFGYTADMLYPRPYHINTYHIKNSNFTNDLLQEGYYFTRQKFKYKAKGGKAIINAEYDVDLTDMIDYIQGSVYGVDGVRAIFGTYIGNAISKYRTTIVTALYEYRSFKNTVNPSEPRPTPRQGLLSGVPKIEEEATVIITELDNETPLMSVILDINSNTTSSSPGIVLYDPWTKYMKQAPSGVQSFPSGTLTSGYTTTGDTMEEKIYYIISESLGYPGREYIPTFGQYAEFNKSVIDKLNFRTNKIRINVVFTAVHDVLDDTTGKLLDESEDCFEFVPWELISKVGRFPQLYPQDFASASIQGRPTQSIYLYDYNRIRYGDNAQVSSYSTLLGASRLLVTGMNLVLLPLENINKQKIDYYTKTILEPNVNPTVYTAVESSVQELTPLTQYLLSLGYDTEYIGVQVANQWKVPYRTFTINPFNGERTYNDNLFYGQGEIASITSISTFKFVSNPSTVEPEVELVDLLNDQKSNWRRAGLEDVIDNITGSVEVIYYSGSPVDITKAALPDVVGTVKSGIVNYTTDGLVNIVPKSYVSASIGDVIDYKRNLGFHLNLELHKWGHPTSSLDSESIARAWREPDTSWAIPKISHKHSLLQKIDSDYVDVIVGTGGSGPTPVPTGLTASYQIYYDENEAQLGSWFNNVAGTNQNATQLAENGQLAYYSTRFLSGSTNSQIYPDVTESFVRFRLKDNQLPTTVGWLFVGLEGWTPQSSNNNLGEPLERYGWIIEPSDFNTGVYPSAVVYNLPNISNESQGQSIDLIDTQPGTPGQYYYNGVTLDTTSFIFDSSYVHNITNNTDKFFEIRASSTVVEFYINDVLKNTILRNNPNTNLRFFTSGIYEGISCVTYGPLSSYPIGYPATLAQGAGEEWLDPTFLI